MCNDIYKGLVTIIMFMVSSVTFGETCSSFNTSKEIIECALMNHPKVRVSNADVAATSALDSVAKQRPNPEVNSQTVWASTYGKPYFYTEYNFAHTFELGGKRNSRIEKAKSELRRSEASRLEAREEVYLETLVILFRLRQLRSEISTVEDALGTFSKIQKQYKSRPRLNPEQQANLRLFELAEGDYRMRLIPLLGERDYFLHRLEIGLGQRLDPILQSLPQIRKSWPSLPSSINQESLANSDVKLAEANLKISASDLSLAKSVAWPDLKIGPTFELQNSIGQNFNAYGFNFVLPLPLYNRNEAGKAYANLEIRKNEVQLAKVLKEQMEERVHYEHNYQRAIEALKVSMSLEDLNKRHEEVEDLFSKGLIAGNLVIELHRQIHDFTKTYNAQELMAAESLTQVYILEGKLPEEIVW